MTLTKKRIDQAAWDCAQDYRQDGTDMIKEHGLINLMAHIFEDISEKELEKHSTYFESAFEHYKYSIKDFAEYD